MARSGWRRGMRGRGVMTSVCVRGVLTWLATLAPCCVQRRTATAMFMMLPYTPAPLSCGAVCAGNDLVRLHAMPATLAAPPQTCPAMAGPVVAPQDCRIVYVAVPGRFAHIDDDTVGPP